MKYTGNVTSPLPGGERVQYHKKISMKVAEGFIHVIYLHIPCMLHKKGDKYKVKVFIR